MPWPKGRPRQRSVQGRLRGSCSRIRRHPCRRPPRRGRSSFCPKSHLMELARRPCPSLVLDSAVATTPRSFAPRPLLAKTRPPSLPAHPGRRTGIGADSIGKDVASSAGDRNAGKVQRVHGGAHVAQLGRPGLTVAPKRGDVASLARTTIAQRDCQSLGKGARELVDRLADHSPRPRIEDDGAVQLAFPSGVLGDFRNSQLVAVITMELPLDAISSSHHAVDAPEARTSRSLVCQRMPARFMSSSTA